MARIRTIKPELWTDPEFVECSPHARLLFIAALNFASDYGVLPDEPRRLGMQCFPAEALDVAPLIDELVNARLWVRRVAPDGVNVLVIRSFKQHQKVSKPNPGRWGDPDHWEGTVAEESRNVPGTVAEESRNVPGTVAEESPPEGKGREGKGYISAEPRAEPRPSDAIFDALVAACGLDYDEMTAHARQSCGVAAAQLAKVGATPDEIRARSATYRRKFPHAALTPHALAKQWATCATRRQQPTVDPGTGAVMLPGADY